MRDNCRPDARQLALLQAGLWDRARALEAWTRFCGQIDDIEALSDDCYRLFPLVALNLKNQPGLLHKERLQSVLRHSWASSQVLIADAKPALGALQEAGIDFLVLKGIALAALYYKHWGLRPMLDVDILVRPRDVPRLVEVLAQAGWLTPRPLDSVKIAELIKFRHEITLKNAKGVEIDVHWHLSSECQHAETEDRFWRDAVPCLIPGLTTKTLEPADQMLHTCIHGTRSDEASAIRWLVDATFIVRHGLNWQRLEQHAKNLQRVEPVRTTLLFLADFGIALPPEVVERWREMEVSRLETLEVDCRARRSGSRERTRLLALAYIRLKQGEQLASFWRDTGAYQRQIHHFKSYSRRMIFLCYLVRYGHLYSQKN